MDGLQGFLEGEGSRAQDLGTGLQGGWSPVPRIWDLRERQEASYRAGWLLPQDGKLLSSERDQCSVRNG